MHASYSIQKTTLRPAENFTKFIEPKQLAIDLINFSFDTDETKFGVF